MLTRRLDHKRVTGLGVMGMAVYPMILSLSRGFGLYLVTSALGGFAWSLVSGAQANYLLEKVPPDDRPSHLAWYNIILNATVLIGSLSGPLIAGRIGLGAALARPPPVPLFSPLFICRMM